MWNRGRRGRATHIHEKMRLSRTPRKFADFMDPLLDHLEDFAKGLDLRKIEPKDTLGISRV